MHLKKTLASGAAVIAMTGLTVASTTSSASANDDTRRVSGSCSGSSDYTLKLSDTGAQLRQQRLNVFINGRRGEDRTWTITVSKDGDRIYRTTRKTNGNITLNREFTADDDADIKVYARAGYGEHCSRTISLD